MEEGLRERGIQGSREICWGGLVRGCRDTQIASAEAVWLGFESEAITQVPIIIETHQAIAYSLSNTFELHVGSEFINLPSHMAKKKAELENEHKQYELRMTTARTAISRGLYRIACRAALDALAYVDGMMQYARKYEKADFKSVPAIDIVLDYSPYMLDGDSLAILDDTLSAHRRIDKNTTVDIRDRLEKAYAIMWKVHALFDFMEHDEDGLLTKIPRRLGGRKAEWMKIVARMTELGLVVVEPTESGDSIRAATRLSRIVNGKCSMCGTVAEAPMAVFLERTSCPECDSHTNFVIGSGLV